MPSQPPRLLPGPTAVATLNSWLVGAVIQGVVWVVVVLVATRLPGAVGVVAGLVVLVVGLVGFWTVVRRLPERVGTVAMAELDAGYTTLPLTWGGFWRPQRGRVHLEYRVPWDYGGTWVLTSTGQVRSAPRPGQLPPGLYPSLERPGQLELWTGAEWGRVFDEPAQPFLRD